MQPETLGALEAAMQYEFQDKSLLITALTHSSYANEKNGREGESNERLEFLGDAVLEMVVSRHIYLHFPQRNEGELTKLRASLVCERSLWKASQRWSLGEYLRLGKGEEQSGGRRRPSIVADACEAVIAAAYLDGGIDAATSVIASLMRDTYREALSGSLFLDSKTELQELLQHSGETEIVYSIIEENGPDHAKTFTAQVANASRVLGQGSGRNKKEAESAAAEDALLKLKEEECFSNGLS